VALPQELPDLGGLRTRAINRRPELQSLAQKLNAKQAALQLAQKDYYPNFTVMGTYNSLWEADEKQWMIGAGINVPLQLDRRRAAETEAEAGIKRLAAELTSQVDTVALQVTRAYEKLIESSHVVSLYRGKFIPTSDENLDAALSGYETGENDFLTLLTAEKNLMLVQLAYHQSLSEFHKRLADLERAIGAPLVFSEKTNKEESPNGKEQSHE